MESQDDIRKQKGQRQRPGKKEHGRYRWAVQIFFVSIVLSAALSFLSNELLSAASLLASFAVLAGFIALGILFDIIGVSVTAADEKPFHSMASHKEAGAKEALRLIRNADKVSSFCNDVVGDICGIVSGTTAAVIVVELQRHFSVQNVLLSLGVTALVSGLTIGGKAVGKNLALEKSTAVIHMVGRIIHVFHRGK